MLSDEDGNAHVQPRQIADALQEHFFSVYSDPNCGEVCDPLFEAPAIGHQMTEVELDFTEEDVLQAIGELKSGSAPGPDGVPNRSY